MQAIGENELESGGILLTCMLCVGAGSADETVRLWGDTGKGKKKKIEGQSHLEENGAEDTGIMDLVHTFRTKATPVFAVQFSSRNLLTATGALNIKSGNK